MAEARPQDNAARIFLIHLALYGAVNVGLAGFNLWQVSDTGEARDYWFQWPLLGWGIGVAAHGLALWLDRLGREGGLLAEQDVRGAAVHLFVYLAVNALLIAVNLIYTPQSVWFFWPLIGWGIGLGVHAWLVYRAVLKRTVEHYALEQRLIGEITLERRAAEIASAISTPQPVSEEVPAQAEQEAPKPKRKRAPAKKRTAAKSRSGAKTKTPAKSGARTKTASRSKPKAGAGKAAASRKRASGKAASASRSSSKKKPKSGRPGAASAGGNARA